MLRCEKSRVLTRSAETLGPPAVAKVATHTKNREKCYRIKTAGKYWGPKKERNPKAPALKELLPRRAGNPAPLEAPTGWKREESARRLVVIFDGGYGFRERKQKEQEEQHKPKEQEEQDDRWENLIPPSPDPNLFIVMFSRAGFPDGRIDHPLWNRIITSHADRTTVVVAADRLRHEGVNISRSLSWERTGRDFGTELWSNPVLQELSKCNDLIVRFGLTGAIHYHRGGEGKNLEHATSTLYYDPLNVEGEYRDRDERTHGRMLGLTAVLTATVSRSIADGLSTFKESQPPVDSEVAHWVAEGLEAGLVNCRILYCHGFGQTHEEVFRLEEKDEWNYMFWARLEANAQAQSPIVRAPIEFNQPAWASLRFKSDSEVEKMAAQIAREGIESLLHFDLKNSLSQKDPTKNKTLRFPAVKFGDCWVVDREEIERFRGRRNLLQGHYEKRPQLPLSIAVFGPPGSGKSYGVREIVKSISPDKEKVEFKTYNLAQFVEPEELAQALLPIRDVALDGKMAVVFFDEFDSQLEGDRLGWLKYFLPIMQDGEFKHEAGTIKTGAPSLCSRAAQAGRIGSFVAWTTRRRRRSISASERARTCQPAPWLRQHSRR